MTRTKIVAFTVAALSALSMSACTDQSTPAGVLGMALKAVQTGNVKALRKITNGDAYNNYGNREGMAELQRKLSGATALGFGKTTVVSAVKWPNGGGAGYTDYEVEITRTTQEIPLAVTFLRATVRCDYSLIDDPVFHSAEGDDNTSSAAPGALAGYCLVYNLD